jgi:hypothetical protein
LLAVTIAAAVLGDKRGAAPYALGIVHSLRRRRAQFCE